MRGGFPGSSVVKNRPANAGDPGGVGSIPGLGRFPGAGNSNPLQYYYFFSFFKFIYLFFSIYFY